MSWFSLAVEEYGRYAGIIEGRRQKDNTELDIC
jgi:hypothetical protein